MSAMNDFTMSVLTLLEQHIEKEKPKTVLELHKSMSRFESAAAHTIKRLTSAMYDEIYCEYE